MYGHLSKIMVKKGDLVEKDDIIGQLGSTGRSTGPHLHFEMKRHGDNINPLLYLVGNTHYFASKLPEEFFLEIQ